MGSVLFYLGSGCFVLGVVVSSLDTVSFPMLLWFAFIAGSLSVLSMVYRTSSAPAIGIMGLCILLCMLGMVRMEYAKWHIVHPWFEEHLDQAVTLIGTVVTEPDVREHQTLLTVLVADVRVQVSTDRFVPVAYGDQVKFSGTVTLPETFETDLGRTFDYPGYLAARGLRYTVPFAKVSVLSSGHGNDILEMLLWLKHRFVVSLERYIVEPEAGLGEGIVLGMKRALGSELENVFRRTGIIHIVVLSGYNIMLVVTFVTHVLFRRFRISVRAVLGVSSIVLFAIMVGPSASVVRASIMASLLLLIEPFGHRYSVTKGLVLAGVAMILWNPYTLMFDVGFQLSFLATLGLIVAAGGIESRSDALPTFLGVRSFVSATLATQLFVTPLILYHIGSFSVVALFVNVLVLPMVPVAMGLTFLTGLVGALSSTLGTVSGIVAYISLGYIITVPTWFASLPFAAVTVPVFPWWVMVSLYVGIAGVWLWFSRRSSETRDQFDEWVIEDDESPECGPRPHSGDLPIFFR